MKTPARPRVELHGGVEKSQGYFEMTLESLVAWGLTTLVTAFIGSYLAGYLRRKGENLATHEDIDKLVKQVSAVTQATKEIEAKISNEVWDRQRRWELKREALFELIKRLAALKDVLTELLATYATDQQLNLQNDPKRGELRVKVGKALLDAAADFDNTSPLVGVACSDGLHSALMDFSVFARDTATKITERDRDALANGMGRLGKRMAHLLDAVRTELERPQ